jgi:hypothetical protein
MLRGSVLSALLASVACVEESALPQDASPEVGACGVLTSGECRGAEFVYCEGSETITEDCADAGGGCAVREGSALCAFPPGARCRSVIDHGNHQHVTYGFCLGESAACVATPDDGRCVERAGACATSDVDTCRGARLVALCRLGQAVLLDCAAYGGRCDAAVRACVGIPLDGVCDTSRRRCATGLECRLPTRRALSGRCVAPSG